MLCPRCVADAVMHYVRPTASWVRAKEMRLGVLTAGGRENGMRRWGRERATNLSQVSPSPSWLTEKRGKGRERGEINISGQQRERRGV